MFAPVISTPTVPRAWRRGPSATVMVCSDAIRSMRLAMERALPHECCGLLIGKSGDDSRPACVLKAIAIRNVHRARSRFELDPIESIQAECQTRKDGLDMLGYFHSHPRSAPTPSWHDRLGVLWPGIGPDLHLIISPDRGWRLYRVRPTEWSIVVTSVLSPVAARAPGRPLIRVAARALARPSPANEPNGSAHA